MATPMFGVSGIGWAYLVAEGLCPAVLRAVVLIVPVVRWIRRVKVDPDWLNQPAPLAAQG